MAGHKADNAFPTVRIRTNQGFHRKELQMGDKGGKKNKEKSQKQKSAKEQSKGKDKKAK